MGYLKIGDKAEGVATGEYVGTCPDCGKRLVVRSGKYGRFVGCEGFRKGCRKTYSLKNFRIYSQHWCDRINLERAVMNCDLKMAEHIRDTNKELNFRACGYCEDIQEALWM